MHENSNPSRLLASALFVLFCAALTPALAVDYVTGADGNWTATTKLTPRDNLVNADNPIVKHDVTTSGEFNLLTPPNHATGIPITGDLLWEASAGAVSYDVYYDEFTPPTTLRGSVVEPVYSYTELVNNTTYFWSVVARDSSGETPCNEDFVFMTLVAAPDAPTCISPIGSNQPVSGYFKWTGGPGDGTVVDSFVVWNGSPTSVPIRYGCVDGTTDSLAYSGLVNNMTYNWYVVAWNAAGSASATPVGFTTIVAAPGKPVCVAPIGENKPVNGHFLWASLSGSNGGPVDSFVVWNGSPEPERYGVVGGGTHSLLYSGLAHNTIYNWYVVAWNAAGSEAANPVGFTTTVAAPADFALLAPANGSVDQPTSGNLTWEASARADSFAIYFGTTNPPTALLRRVAGNVTSTEYLCPNGQCYYWSVVAENAGGSTNATDAPWHFTTIAAAPGPFSLLAPPNHTNNIAVAGNMIWRPSARATSYNVYYDDFTPPTTLRGSVTGPNYPYAGLANGTTYYWSVVATNAGGSTPCHEDFDFTTIVAAPHAPTCKAPIGSLQPVDGCFRWKPNPGGGEVDSFVVWNGRPTSVPARYGCVDGTTDSLAYSGLAHNTTYCWHVVAWNAAGSAAATEVSFATIAVAPGKPVCVAPVGENVPVNGHFLWYTISGSNGDDVDSFVVWNGSPEPERFGVVDGGTQRLAYSGLLDSTTYNWYVVAWNGAGSAAATQVSFTTTVAAPADFALLAPANGAVDQPTSGNLSWEASARADSFAIYFGTTNPPTTLLRRVAGDVTSTEYSCANGECHYWSVVAENAGGSTNATGAPWHFTTIVAAPGPFSLMSPPNHAVSIPMAGEMSWGVATGAVSYDVYYDEFTPPTTLRGSVAAPSYPYAGLTNNTPYYWSVVATNAGGSTPCIADFDFTTIVAAPTIDVIEPNGGELLIPGGFFDITWNQGGGAADYDSVYYSYNGGWSWVGLARLDTPATTYRWTPIPNTPTVQGKIKLVAVNAAARVEAESPELFTIAQFDAGVTTILAPTGWADTSLQQVPKAKIRNMGNVPATGVQATFRVFLTTAPVTVYADTVTLDLAVGAESTVTFDTWVKPYTPRGYATSCRAVLAGDLSPFNDSLYGWFVVTAMERGHSINDSISGGQPNRDGVMAEPPVGFAEGVSIRPNPLVNGFVTLSYGLPRAGVATVRVFNVTGRGVLTRTLGTGRYGSTTLDLRHLSNGVYLVKVTSDDFTATRKLVVQH